VYHNQMRTLLSSPCQLRLGVALRCLSLSPYKYLIRYRVALGGWSSIPGVVLVGFPYNVHLRNYCTAISDPL